MLKRNLLYTGVTRGKRLVVLVGQKKVVAIAVRNAPGRRRWSKLDEWLAGPTEGAESAFLAGAGAPQSRMPYKISAAMLFAIRSAASWTESRARCA